MKAVISGGRPIASGQLYHCLVQTCRVRIAHKAKATLEAQARGGGGGWGEPKSLALPEKSPIVAALRQTPDMVRQILPPVRPLAVPWGRGTEQGSDTHSQQDIGFMSSLAANQAEGQRELLPGAQKHSPCLGPGGFLKPFWMTCPRPGFPPGLE